MVSDAAARGNPGLETGAAGSGIEPECEALRASVLPLDHPAA